MIGERLRDSSTKMTFKSWQRFLVCIHKRGRLEEAVKGYRKKSALLPNLAVCLRCPTVECGGEAHT
jgi:hypothetical protein